MARETGNPKAVHFDAFALSQGDSYRLADRRKAGNPAAAHAAAKAADAAPA